jgi:predicted amidohydrolase
MSMEDLHCDTVDDPSGRRAFRVQPKRPAEVVATARQLIQRAGEIGCDLLMFPELCLTPEGQQQLADVLRTTTHRFGGRPWLVVAGTSHTVATGGAGLWNRSLVFHGSGSEILAHNKLFPYVMSSSEADRYGIGEALRWEPRVEDIVVEPHRLEILECPLGRCAVLICEDFSNHEFVEAIVKELEIDWLLVPVMDGVQNKVRWTAKYAYRYAEDYGANVFVGTCGALPRAHREFCLSTGLTDPGTGLALLVQRRYGSLESARASPKINVLSDPTSCGLASLELSG